MFLLDDGENKTGIVYIDLWKDVVSQPQPGDEARDKQKRCRQEPIHYIACDDEIRCRECPRTPCYVPNHAPALSSMSGVKRFPPERHAVNALM